MAVAPQVQYNPPELKLPNFAFFGTTLVDGGFGMGEHLPLFAAGETDTTLGSDTVTTSDGSTKVVPKKAKFGSLSSGGLY